MTFSRVLILTLLIITGAINLSAQPSDKPFIRLTNPASETNRVNAPRQFIVGSTCKDCSLLINREKVKVYPTGAFAYELALKEGDTSFSLVAISAKGKSASKLVQYNYTRPAPALPVKEFGIERIETFPEGNLVLQAGDKVQFRVKAYPGQMLTTMNRTRLYELPVTQTNGMPGIYQGEYEVRPDDSISPVKYQVTITDSTGRSEVKETSNTFALMSPWESDVVITTGRLAHLEYGLGEDRLGGAKIGYIDSLIPLRITGKAGSHYKVKLAGSRTAYIPDDVVTVMPKGSFAGSSLTGKISVTADSAYDYVLVPLFTRLPYQSFQQTDPSRIMVDIFGATSNTNWINQVTDLKEVEQVDYEQVSDDIFRINIKLKHRQHWGHSIYYRGNTLVIRIKPQPVNLTLKGLVIAVDAGHGGSNTGAGGPTGVSEKTLTLAVSLKLQKTLEKEGARVIMTRTTEKFFDNKERILFYRDSLPDLLLSIHLNSSADPIHVSGTSTFYRYIGFRPLSQAIYKRMLQLGLKDYGNNGSFNFMLNSPTEYPNALVEMLFLSNPEEEMKILDEDFQWQAVEKMLLGVKDFLQGFE